MQFVLETIKRLSWVLLLLVLTFLIPVINIFFVCSNDNGTDVCVNICSIVCSASAAASCSTKFFGKYNKCMPALVTISLVISTSVFITCLLYQYFGVLGLDVRFIVALTIISFALAVIIIAYFLFKENPYPVSVGEITEANEMANGPGGDDCDIDVTTKGGK